jgi:hypothetical protein
MKGRLEPESSKTEIEIPKQVRDDKNESPPFIVMLNLGLMKIRLVSASPFVTVNRIRFSGVILIKRKSRISNASGHLL